MFHIDNQYSGRKKVVFWGCFGGFLLRIFDICLKLCVSGLANSQFLSNSYCGRQTPHFYCWTWWYMAWTLFWPVWASCTSCVPSQMLAHPQPTVWWRLTKELRKFWVMQELLLNSQNFGVTHSVLATNPKHCTTRAPMKKMNSILGRASAALFFSYPPWVCVMIISS